MKSTESAPSSFWKELPIDCAYDDVPTPFTTQERLPEDNSMVITGSSDPVQIKLSVECGRDELQVLVAEMWNLTGAVLGDME